MEQTKPLKKKKSNKFKFIVIIFVFTMLIVALALLYYSNSFFKTRVDGIIGKGRADEEIGKMESYNDVEQNEMKEDLAEYYLAKDVGVAADKLYIMKKNDEILYSEIIRLMNAKSSSRTGQIITGVRSIENGKNLLADIHEEISEENNNSLLNEISSLESQDIVITLNEIENRFNNDGQFTENVSYIFTNMNETKAADILYYIDEEVRDEILYSLDNNKRISIEDRLMKKENRVIELRILSNLYETKPIELAKEEIGNTEIYSMEELGVIYDNLSIIRAAEILSNIEDDTFIQELFTAIRKEEQLNSQESSIDEINRAIQFVTQYNDRIDNLVNVYENMEPDKVANIVEEMLDNNTIVSELELDSEPAIQISESSIIIDVLSKIRNKTLSEIINYVSIENASRLTQMLARP